MADNLKRISEILQDMVTEFKQSNDEWEKRYGQSKSDVLRPSDDAKTYNGGNKDGSL